jgi:O-antigen/teichoic acid export membrane protein
LRDYFKKSFSTGILNVGGSAIITAIFIPLIVQKLGLELYGKWAMVFIFPSFSGIADMGISKAMVYLIPKQSNQDEINEIYSAGFVINSTLIILLSIICIFVYLSGVNVWNTEHAISKSFGDKLFITGSFIACCSLATQFYRSVLEAYYKIYYANIGFLLQTIVTYIPIYILAHYSKDITKFIYCTAAMYILIAFFHFFVMQYTCSAMFNFPRKNSFKKIFLISFNFFSIGLLISIVYPVNRYLLISLSDDTKAYGVFDIALKIAMMANSFLALFATPMLSIFSGYGSERISEIKSILNRSLVLLGAAYFFGCVTFYIVGEKLLQWVFKVQTGEVYIATFVLMVGICLTGVSEPFSRALLAIGRLRFIFNIKVSALAINLMIIVFLRKVFPLLRISLGIATAYIITSIVVMVYFYKVYYKNSEVKGIKKWKCS